MKGKTEKCADFEVDADFCFWNTNGNQVKNPKFMVMNLSFVIMYILQIFQKTKSKSSLSPRFLPLYLWIFLNCKILDYLLLLGRFESLLNLEISLFSIPCFFWQNYFKTNHGHLDCSRKSSPAEVLGSWFNPAWFMLRSRSTYDSNLFDPWFDSVRLDRLCSPHDSTTLDSRFDFV